MSLASCVLVAYDDDELKGGKRAGDTGASYWLEKLPHAIQWLPWSHDLNDMLREGLDIREWVRLGVSTYTLSVSMQEQVAPAPPVEIASVSEQITGEQEQTPDTGGLWLCAECGIDLNSEQVEPYYDEDGIAYCDKHGPQASVKIPALTQEQFLACVNRLASSLSESTGQQWTVTPLKPGYTLDKHVEKLAQEQREREQRITRQRQRFKTN